MNIKVKNKKNKILGIYLCCPLLKNPNNINPITIDAARAIIMIGMKSLNVPTPTIEALADV